jgi:hypothetical protein
MKSRDDIVVALILVLGLLFPTSIGEEPREYLVVSALVILLGLVLSLLWKYGARPGALVCISLPIVMILTVCTIFDATFRLGGTIVAQYCLLAAVLALNLRKVRAGRVMNFVFVVVNVVWIFCGMAILIGSEAVSGFIMTWYSQFYPELVPTMLALHKPVFTFATHSLAGFFTYLFFWINWETYKSRGSAVNLGFALCELVLLLATTSFTSLAFATVAVAQISAWLWKRNRKLLFASAAGVALAVVLVGSRVANEVELLRENPEVATSVLNADNSGLLVRYGVGGTVRGTIDYILDHPFSPIGFTYPSTLFLGDSGPVEYILRGSIPLLFLIYIGLYRFLTYNSIRRKFALTLFFVFLAFEAGFDALTYFRTLYLLPFLAVYLNEMIPERSVQHA